MNDATVGIVAIIVLAAIAIAALVWLARIASNAILLFTLFVMGLPTIVVILLFILFPPSLIVFLVGYLLLQLGFDVEGGDDANR